MPLDSHSYLVAQGWEGKGTGLREGAISRPLAVSQKKTLAGLGKDRDEAFPFWDHLFSAAAKSIQVKIFNDDDDEEEDSSTTAPVLKRTTTGILSNRRPVDGISAHTSGTSTPDADAPRISLLATAKREAAKRGLYSKFYRGPVLGPDEATVPIAPIASSSSNSAVTPKGAVESEILHADVKSKKRERSAEEIERRVQKKLRKELKEKARAEKEVRRKSSKKGKEKAGSLEDVNDGGLVSEAVTKEERRRKRKEEKTRSKAAAKEKRKRAMDDSEATEGELDDEDVSRTELSKKRKREDAGNIDSKKKKRKRKDGLDT